VGRWGRLWLCWGSFFSTDFLLLKSSAESKINPSKRLPSSLDLDSMEFGEVNKFTVNCCLSCRRLDDVICHLPFLQKHTRKWHSKMPKLTSILNQIKIASKVVPKPLDKVKTVSVFGSSTAKPGDANYKTAVELGGRLAKAKFQIMSGGYHGTMEALSKGASEEKCPIIAGVLVPAVFPKRKNGNDYLTIKIEEKSIEQRLATLVGGASAFIVLPGSIGTLTEFIMAWNTAVLAPLSGNRPPPIIAFKDPWEAVINGIQSTLKVPQTMLDMIQYVSSAEEAVQKLLETRPRSRI
jgi:uncharacterized protein (TIGR00725 family)